MEGERESNKANDETDYTPGHSPLYGINFGPESHRPASLPLRPARVHGVGVACVLGVGCGDGTNVVAAPVSNSTLPKLLPTLSLVDAFSVGYPGTAWGDLTKW